MNTISNHQSWLRPRPEHIDQNFEEFLKYLRGAHSPSDSLYPESLALLDERVGQLLEERREAPVYRHFEPSDAGALEFAVRLLSAWLLSVKEPEYGRRKQVILALLNSLYALCGLTRAKAGGLESLAQRSRGKLLEMALSVATGRSSEALSIGWSDVIQPVAEGFLSGSSQGAPRWSVDSFLARLLSSRLGSAERSRYEGKGELRIQERQLTVGPGRAVMAAGEWVSNELLPRLGLRAWSEKEAHLKESKRDDLEAITECLESALGGLERSEKPEEVTELREYQPGAEVAVEVVKTDVFGVVMRSLDPAYKPVEGRLMMDYDLSLFKKNYPLEMWKSALPKGTRMFVKLLPGGGFSITEPFLDFLEGQAKVGAHLKCKYLRTLNEKQRFYEFVSEDGLVLFVPLFQSQLDQMDEEFNATFEVVAYRREEGLKGCINAKFVHAKDDYKAFDEHEERRKLVEDFVFAMGEVPDYEAAAEVVELPRGVVKEICYVLNGLQSREGNPRDRFRLLGMLRLLCALGEFPADGAYMAYLSEYIKTLIQFAEAQQDESRLIKIIEAPAHLGDNEAILHGTDVLNILSRFAQGYTDEVNQALNPYLESDDPLLKQTASLVQSYNRLQGILEPRTLRDIKRQILEGLSIVVGGDSTLDLSNQAGASFGYEDDTKEFKCSFLIPPTDAREKRQEYTVCRAVCAMMNNQGGTIYLGVKEDHNHIGRAIGVDGDLHELASRDRRRTTLDDYVQYITFKGEEWLGETFWSYVSVKADVEHNIVRIQVEPYPYDVVSMKDGKMYLRKNNLTTEIQEQTTIDDIRRKRQAALRLIDDKLVNLQDAISKRLKVRLLGYHSSHTEQISNRIVEPIEILDNEYLVGLEEGESLAKVFKISRIDKVAVSEMPWSQKQLHGSTFIDLFRSGPTVSGKRKQIRCVLRLPARNALVEQYPHAKSRLQALDDTRWRFEAEVNTLTPFMHFYLNYAPHIEIEQAPGLLEETRAYLHANFDI